MSLYIRKLGLEEGREIYQMFEELPAEENGFINPAAGKYRDEFQEWLKRADACSRQTEILDGWKVPETIFLFFEDDRPVGFGKLRHCLTDRLLEEGGNTGYCIRPSERNRGLGKKFLARLVEEGKKMGMDSFLLIIHNDNQPSLQVALANGGQIQKITENRNYIWIGAGMTRVYFVRHAQPDHGWEEDRTRPLTEEGKRDSKIVLDTLGEKKIDVFYCSPYKRSMDTIAETAAYFGKKIIMDERFREREKGVHGNGPGMFEKRWDDHDYHEENGESIRMVQERNIEALSEILAANPGKNIVIGTHGTALSTILNYYDPVFGCNDFLRIIDWMPYVIELDFVGDKRIGVKEHCYIEKEFKGGKD
ncbi:MAG: GNAT family N-acetyltransferase [Eubacterium sp.]|nr:GNAT family N-acetyltransferase [Eubacterium sp.]